MRTAHSGKYHRQSAYLKSTQMKERPCETQRDRIPNCVNIHFLSVSGFGDSCYPIIQLSSSGPLGGLGQRTMRLTSAGRDILAPRPRRLVPYLFVAASREMIYLVLVSVFSFDFVGNRSSGRVAIECNRAEWGKTMYSHLE